MMGGKGFLKLKNAAKYLDMSEKTFKKYVMPFVSHRRIGNNIYFSVKELDDFMLREDFEMKNKAEEILRKII